MPGRFTFLEEQFPKLSEYGRKAEESISSDPNISLLNLGRIAEYITEILCRKNNITSSEKIDALVSRGAITEEVSLKIKSLTEIKNEAANNEYDSEMACSRLILTAEELCRWFLLTQSEGRFAFLADIFPPDKPVPILMNLSELGREAEENLYTNTRYCIICLGDMGEAIADRLISGNSIETHEKDQIARIDVLAEKYIITDETKAVLHRLRIARNKALHERYNDEYTSEHECRKFIDDALSLCEWLFRIMMKPGYVVKARITGETEGGYSAVMGRIPAHVPAGEGADAESFTVGEKYAFKVSDSDSDPVTLTFLTAGKNYSSSPEKLYAKYKPGQDVHVTIKSLSNSTGAVVEMKDGLEARIPPSELGRKIYRYDESNTKMVKFDAVARVKWFSLTQYPPLILSVKDVEEVRKEHSQEIHHQPEKNPAMSDLDFRMLCKSAPYERVIKALDEGANPNAANSNNTTALMMAAQYNKNSKVVKALIDSGANIDVQNHKGNSALMYAAMTNTPEIVRMIYDAGADISLVNSEGKRAADFAVTNRKLNGTDLVSLLRGESDDSQQADSIPESSQSHSDSEHESPVTPQESLPKTQPLIPEDKTDEELSCYEYEIRDPEEYAKTPEDIETAKAMKEELQREFLRICRSGTEDEIAEAVSAGVSVNVTNRSSATALMFAAQSNTAQAVEILIHAGAFLDAQDDNGNTALIYAASYNNYDVVETLIDAGADRGIKNLAGHKASEYALKNYRLDGTEALRKL